MNDLAKPRNHGLAKSSKCTAHGTATKVLSRVLGISGIALFTVSLLAGQASSSLSDSTLLGTLGGFGLLFAILLMTTSVVSGYVFAQQQKHLNAKEREAIAEKWKLETSLIRFWPILLTNLALGASLPWVVFPVSAAKTTILACLFHLAAGWGMYPVFTRKAPFLFWFMVVFASLFGFIISSAIYVVVYFV